MLKKIVSFLKVYARNKMAGSSTSRYKQNKNLGAIFNLDEHPL